MKIELNVERSEKNGTEIDKKYSDWNANS